MLALLHLSQQQCQTLKQHKDSIPPQKKTEKNNNRVARSWLLSLDFLLGIKHRYHDIQKVKLRAECVSSLQFTDSWLHWVQRKNHSLLSVSWVAPSVHTDSLQLTHLFPFHTLLFHSAGADGRHSSLEALHNIPLEHTVYSVKKEVHTTGFSSVVCLSHLQSNVF